MGGGSATVGFEENELGKLRIALEGGRGWLLSASGLGMGFLWEIAIHSL